MKLSFLLAAGLFCTASAATAQDTLRLELPRIGVKAPAENKNNIRFVDFDTYHTDNSAREAASIAGIEKELSPTYLDACPSTRLWSQGWFVGIAGGGSAFVGDPVGCEDLFGRVKPLLQVCLGKWIVPSVGTRLQYQGFRFKDGVLSGQSYNSVQLDMMLDVASLWDRSEEGPRATVIPFAGCGMVQDRGSHQHPFSLHYGIIGSVRLSPCLSLDLELSSMNTFRDFDGYGSGSSFGDQFFNASLGLTCTVGGNKYRQRRVVDAEPYMDQNRRLMQACHSLKEENAWLASELTERDKALQQYEKILHIKDWLAANLQGPEDGESEDDGSTADGMLQGDSSTGDYHSDAYSRGSRRTIGFPYNNYSGLNSLRERLRARGMKGHGWEEGWEGPDDTDADTSRYPQTVDTGESHHPEDGMTANQDLLTSGGEDSAGEDRQAMGKEDYLNLLASGRACLGTPVLFFFELNSTDMTEPSQMENLREIAELVKMYDLKVKVVGAADSATGSEGLNRNLSSLRADMIAAHLRSFGVRAEQIRKAAAGGIDRYRPAEANRNTRVELYL